MANFKTHIQFATIGSAAVSTLLLNSHILSPQEALLCWFAGTVGGILPDIDSDNSHALSIMFGLLSLLVCFSITIYGVNRFPILWVWLACLVAFVSINYGARKIFEQFTVHRGIFHSLVAGLFFSLLAVAVASLAGISSTASWFIGAFTGFGFFLHLLLDELYSVDFMGASLKRSFGSAMKLASTNWIATALFGVATASLLFLVPPHQGFSTIILNPQTYTEIATNLIAVSPIEQAAKD